MHGPDHAKSSTAKKHSKKAENSQIKHEKYI